MFILYTQELNKTPALALLMDTDINVSFKQLAFYEKNTINPEVMFWVENSNNPDIVLVPSCTN